MSNLPTHPDQGHYREHHHQPLLPHTSHSNLQDEQRHLPHLMQEVQTAVHGRDTKPSPYLPQQTPQKPEAAHFNTPGHSTDDLSVMVIEKMKTEDSDLRKKRRATGFTIYSHCPRQRWTWTHRYVITTYATTTYAADVITLDCKQLLLTRHIDAFCLATYKNMSVCHVCTPEEDHIG